MTVVIATDQPGALEQAAAAVEQGAVIGVPTDTVYGLVCLWSDAAAIDRLFAVKERPDHKALPVLLGDAEQATAVVRSPVDAAAQALVVRPQHFDVLVMENFLGDILSDLGGGTVGGIGLCPSGNIGDEHAYFEPIHGSAPDIAGQGVCNPIGQIWSGAMMLEHLGHEDAARAVESAIEDALADPEVLTPDMGGKANTVALGETIARAVAEPSP